MTIDIRGWDNERGIVTVPIPDVFAAAHDLVAAAWLMQIRPSAGSSALSFEASSATSTASYSNGWATFVFPLAAVAGKPGIYTHDFGFVPVGGDFVRVDGGAFVLESGVSRKAVS